MLYFVSKNLLHRKADDELISGPILIELETHAVGAGYNALAHPEAIEELADAVGLICRLQVTP